MEIDKRVLEIIGRDYSIATEIELADDGSQLVAAWLVDFPGCVAQGGTVSEAMERLRALLKSYFRELLEQGVEIPEPSPPTTIRVPVLAFYDPTTGDQPGLQVA